MRRNRIMAVDVDHKHQENVANEGQAEGERPSSQPSVEESEEKPIGNVDDLLYEIGLCLTSVRERPKRRAIDNPIVIAIFCSIYLFARICCIFTDHRYYLHLLGDSTHYFGAKIHFNIFIILPLLFILSSQMNYYYNYKRGIKPTFVRVFQMMSGLVTPNSVGLYKDSDVKRLLRYRIYFRLLKLNNNYIITLCVVIFVMTSFIFNETIDIVIKYGFISAIQGSLIGYYCSNIIYYQIIFLYIISKYLKFKIKNLNENVIEMKKNKRFIKIRKILNEFDVIYREINEYNTTYWSKFLFIFWLIFGNITIFVFMVTYSDLHLTFKMILFYATILSIILFNFLFSTVCSLNSEANKSYKIFHSFIVVYSQTKGIRFICKLFNKMKVILFYNKHLTWCYKEGPTLT